MKNSYEVVAVFAEGTPIMRSPSGKEWVYDKNGDLVKVYRYSSKFPQKIYFRGEIVFDIDKNQYGIFICEYTICYHGGFPDRCSDCKRRYLCLI